MEPNSKTLTDFPVEIVQKQLRPSYIYRLPDNDKMCHRFSINHITDYGFTLLCIACHGVYLKKKKQKQPIPHPSARRAHGCSMETDPSLGHHEECKPVDYSETIKTYQPMIEEINGKNGKWTYPLLKVVKSDTKLIVHRFKEDPSQCLRFMYRHLTSNGDMAVVCSPCTFIQKKTKMANHVYKMNEDGFLEDPRLLHLPGCSPLLYKELMMNHTILDQETRRNLIELWCTTEYESVRRAGQTTNSIEKQQHQDTHLLAPGFGVIESKNSPTYFYEIPNSNRCLRFHINTFGRKNTNVTCVECRNVYARMKAEGVQGGQATKVRATDGFSMKEDPTENHSPGCEQQIYSEVVKMYRAVETENSDAKGQFAFTLSKMRKIGYTHVIYRFMDDPNKCYTFVAKKSKSSWLVLTCNGCSSVKDSRKRKKTKMNDVERHITFTTHRVTETGFMDDPLLGHHPDCVPQNYESVMKKNEYLDKATAASFLKGNFELSEEAGDKRQTDFPALVMQRKHAVSFISPVPHNDSHSYMFHQLVHGANSQLFCSTCLSPGDMEPSADVLIRTSDGFSMEADPAENHLDHCRGRPNMKIWDGNSYHREDNTDNSQNKYAFPLSKRTKRESYCAIFRLKDDQSLCHRFNSLIYASKLRHLLVSCGQCISAASRARRLAKQNNISMQNKSKLKTYRVTFNGFLDDPSLGHISGCEALRFDHLMREYVISGEDETRDFIKHEYSSIQTHGIDIGRRHSKKESVSCKFENIDEDENSTYAEAEHISSKQVTVEKQSLNKRGNLEGSNELIIIKSKRISVDETCEDAKEDITQIIADEQSKNFSRVYDVPFFCEDEVQVTKNDRTIILEFNRQEQSVGRECCFLRYSIDLPPSVDMSTVETTWNQGQITLTAEKIH